MVCIFGGVGAQIIAVIVILPVPVFALLMHRPLYFVVYVQVLQQHVVIFDDLLGLGNQFVEFCFEHGLGIGEEVVSNAIESQVAGLVLIELQLTADAEDVLRIHHDGTDCLEVGVGQLLVDAVILEVVLVFGDLLQQIEVGHIHVGLLSQVGAGDWHVTLLVGLCVVLLGLRCENLAASFPHADYLILEAGVQVNEITEHKIQLRVYRQLQIFNQM